MRNLDLSKKAVLHLILFAAINIAAQAQDSSTIFFDQQTKKYSLYTGGVYLASMVGLNQLWYKDYPQSSFHTFNDNKEWFQVDKVGHFYSAYTLTKLSFELLNAKGNKAEKKSAILSGTTTFLFLSSIEVFDGFSKEWGFSWGDMIANTAGISVFTAQELLFKKQYLRIKYAYLNTDFREQRPSLLGENTLQGAFKDYNGQTYWASFNLNNFHRNIRPKWLSIAVGYGAEEMLFANAEQSVGNLKPYRQYYIGLDIDFEKIETKKKWLKGVFTVINCIKFPSPAFEFSEQSKFHWITF